MKAIWIHILLTGLLYIPYYVYNALGSTVRIDFLALSVFYLSLTFGKSISIIYVMLLGLLNDNLCGCVLGMHSLSYTIIYVVAITNISSLLWQKFRIVWISFIALTIVSFILFVLFSYWAEQGLSYNNILSYIATIFAYPIYHFLATKIIKRMCYER